MHSTLVGDFLQTLLEDLACQRHLLLGNIQHRDESNHIENLSTAISHLSPEIPQHMSYSTLTEVVKINIPLSIHFFATLLPISFGLPFCGTDPGRSSDLADPPASPETTELADTGSRWGSNSTLRQPIQDQLHWLQGTRTGFRSTRPSTRLP